MLKAINRTYDYTATLQRAENLGFYVVESLKRGLSYIVRDGEFLLITPQQGYIRLEKRQIEQLMEELPLIYKDVCELEREGSDKVCSNI